MLLRMNGNETLIILHVKDRMLGVGMGLEGGMESEKDRDIPQLRVQESFWSYAGTCKSRPSERGQWYPKKEGHALEAGGRTTFQ